MNEICFPYARVLRILVAGSVLLGLFGLGACDAPTAAPAPMFGDGGCVCPGGFKCSDDGSQCQTCTPSCTGKQCGDDGCGGSCGGCAMYEGCNASGACEKLCDLPPLQQAATLNLDLKVFKVTGVVTLKGAPLADDPSERGRLIFRDKKSGSSLTVSVGTKGPVNLQIPLMAGSYTVSFDSTGAQKLLPQQLVVVRDDFVVDKDSTLGIDLKTVAVTGTVTLAGQRLPDDTNNRGSVVFRPSAGGSSISVDVGLKGAATYTTRLYSGTYDIGFDSTGAQIILPRQQVVQLPGQQLTADGKVDLDLKTVNFSGEITRNGAVMPDSMDNRGSLILTRRDDGGQLTLTVPLTGAARFAGTVYSGTYDLSFDSTGNQIILPRQVVPVASNVSLSANKTSNFDLKVVALSGTATLNGAPLPADTSTRGDIVFVRSDNRSTVRFTLPSSGPGAYTLKAYAGSYNVAIDSTGSQTMLPHMSMTLQKNVALTSDQKLDVALKTARISGSVTLNGGTIPDDTNSRGNVVLIDRQSGARIFATIPPTGATSYTLTVYQGAYGLQFDSTGPQKVLPNLVAALPAITASADATVNVPLTTFDVSGSVHLNGAIMPAEPAGMSRGKVILASKLTGSQVVLDVRATGDARYTTKVYAGSYNVIYDATGSQNLLPQQAPLLLNGCVAPDASCTKDKADITGAWLLTYLDPSWGVMSLDLHQNGNTITGYSDVWWGSGPIKEGVRRGDSIHMIVGGNIAATSDGQLANGCFMSGGARANTGPGSDWIAERLQ